MKSPIFLFSLPRSGSTLLQKVLMSHKDIASVAEPWLMLPFSYAYKKEGIITEYAHYESYIAFEDFINNLPNKEDDYYQALSTFVNILYEKQCLNNEKYFLDKTPRYYYIIPEIAKVFPDAKFIFLFRNPIHVMSSMVQTWSDNRFKKMYAFERDVNYGPKALTNGYELLKGKAYALQYEEYVLDPEKYTKEICEYLEIDFDENMLSSFAVQDTKGRMGDPTGIKNYNSISPESLEKWKKTFCSNFRKHFLIRYINTMDENVLKIQGYDKNTILNEVNKLPVQYNSFIQDSIDLFYSSLIKNIKKSIYPGKSFKVWRDNKLFD